MARNDVIEYKCDVCGKVTRVDFEPTRKTKNPYKVVQMPMKKYDCEGKNFSKGLGEVDLCEQCYENYWNYVQERYDASDYFGIKMKGCVE